MLPDRNFSDSVKSGGYTLYSNEKSDTHLFLSSERKNEMKEGVS